MFSLGIESHGSSCHDAAPKCPCNTKSITSWALSQLTASAHMRRMFRLHLEQYANFTGLGERIFILAQVALREAVDVSVGALRGSLDDLAADFDVAIGVFGIDDRDGDAAVTL